jgi:hypothetical protein
MSNAWDDVLAKRGVKLLKPSDGKAATAAAATTGETVEQIEARVRAEMKKYFADVENACSIAGRPEAAAGFVSAGKSVSEVIAALGSGRARPKG